MTSQPRPHAKCEQRRGDAGTHPGHRGLSCESSGKHLDEFTCEHEAAASFLLGDGSVLIVNEMIDLKIYPTLAT